MLYVFGVEVGVVVREEKVNCRLEENKEEIKVWKCSMMVEEYMELVGRDMYQYVGKVFICVLLDVIYQIGVRSVVKMR